jgi:hypothetical protein
MHQYPTPSAWPSDMCYGDVNITVPQGGTQWGPGHPDSSHSSVNCDADDRQRAQHLRASQSLPSNSTPATTYTATSRDSYPAQAQSHCSAQYPYPLQPHPSTVNYVLPPCDFAEYPVSRYFVLCDETEYSLRHHQIHAGNVHHGGQYPPHGSTATHYQYPPSDPVSFHPAAYDSAGCFSRVGTLCSPLDGQQQHIHSSYSHYEACLVHYEHYAQPPIPPVLPSSSSSELGHALVETPLPESQHINHGSITLPSLAMPSPLAPKYDISETLIGLIPVKTEYATGVSGRPFSPMASLNTLSISCELAPRPREKAQEQVHIFPASVVPHGPLHHRQHTRDLFSLVQEYPAFTSPPASKVCSPHHICHLCLPRGVAASSSTVPRDTGACLFS